MARNAWHLQSRPVRAIGRCLTLAAMALCAPSLASDYVVLTSGQPSGTMTVVSREATRDISYSFNDRGRGPDVRSSVATGPGLLPVTLSVDGVDYYKLAVAERFERTGATATWRAANDRGETGTGGFYLPAELTPEHLAMLARALLRAPGNRLALLPAGEARLDLAREHSLSVAGVPRAARLFMIHGLGFEPRPIWLDDQGELLLQGSNWFATVRRDVEAQAAELIRLQMEAADAAELARAASLMHRPAGAVVFRNVSVFDAQSRSVRSNMAVTVLGERIASVVADREAAIPAGAIVIDGTGNTLLPGLWDMHVHLTTNRQGLLHLAAGVTSVRDLANQMDETLERRRRFDTFELPGPRMMLAGFIDGPGPNAGPVRVLAGTPDEMRAAVAGYAARGYGHIKLYSSLRPDLVPVAADEARRRGMRLSGHVPAGMTMREAVEAGFEEVHHLNFMALNFMGPEINASTSGIARITAIAEHAWEIDPASSPVRDFIAHLRARGTVIDPTMSLYEEHLLGRPGQPAPNLAAVIDRLPPVVSRGSRGSGLARTDEEVRRNAASFQSMLGLLRALHDGGVTLVAGTDAMAGFTFQRELELYEQAGIAPADVLYIATLGAARVAGLDAELGSVTAGKLADLILVEGDPSRGISALRELRLVMRGGMMLDPSALLAEAGVLPPEQAGESAR